jgi:replicative DNA helicase
MTVPELNLPADVFAERLILGSILLSDDQHQDVAGVLSMEDFNIEKPAASSHG